MSVMALRRQAAVLKAKAVASLRQGIQAFNDHQEDGRQTAVLLHFQHAFEMLLKAGLEQRRQRVFDVQERRAITFKKCVNMGCEHLGLTEDEAGTLKALDSLRDYEQHWLVSVPEGMLYLHCRAGTTLFDELLLRVFGERLERHLPRRVLPLSSDPPRDIQVLIDEEYSVVGQLLAPGRRKRTEARAHIRGLLAVGAHVQEDMSISEREVDRVEEAVKEGRARAEALPLLSDVASIQEGDGINLRVHIVKKDGVPVRLVGPDEGPGSGAIREVDLEKKFHWSKTALARKLALSTGRCKALRWWLGVDEEAERENCYHDFLGTAALRQYSDSAYTRMRGAIRQGVDVDRVYREYRAGGYGRSPRSG